MVNVLLLFSDGGKFQLGLKLHVLTLAAQSYTLLVPCCNCCVQSGVVDNFNLTCVTEQHSISTQDYHTLHICEKHPQFYAKRLLKTNVKYHCAFQV